MISSVISLQSIDNVITKVERTHKNKSLLLKNSLVNPIFGFLFQSTGILNNLRFYSPEISIEIKSEVRQYSSDSSTNDFYKLLIELFPSPLGVLSISKTDNKNFVFIAAQSKCEALEFLANMFTRILNPEQKPKKVFAPEKFRNIEALFMSNSSSFGPQNTRILKLSAIHTFVINFADCEEDLERYLESILKEINNDGSLDIYDFPCDIIQVTLRSNKEFMSFPYSNMNRPPSNVLIPIFNRAKKEEENPFIEDSLFPDCADVLLLNICNCLLFDTNTGTYCTATLPEGSEIAKFYTKHNKLFVISKEIRKEWSKVVQGLDDFNDEIKKKPYNTHLIVYKREMRNEIKSGIINMMNVLIKIFKVDHKAFWRNFKGKRSIEGKLNQLFNLITPSFENRSLSEKIYLEELFEFDSMGRRDFSGHFNLIFKLPTETEVTVNIKHFTSHAEMSFVQSENKNCDNKDICALYKSLPNTLPLIFLKKYIEPSLSKSYVNLDCDILQNIFFSRNIDNNEHKKIVLENIFKYIIGDEYVIEGKSRSETIELLKKIVINVLSTVALQDSAIKKMFSPFLVYQDSLTEQEIVDFWISSFRIRNLAIYRLWNAKILLLNIEKLSIKFPKMTEKLAKVLFDTLENCSSLKSLKLKKIPENIMQMVCGEIGKLQKLNSLDISESEIKIKCTISLANSLKNLHSLEELNLSNKKILGKIKEKSKSREKILNAISSLENLKILNLSDNHFGLEQNLNFSNAIQNMKSLEVLDLGNNSISRTEDVKAICIALGELFNLTSINLSGNGIGPDDTEFVSATLAKLPNLTVFRYSNNNAGALGGLHLSKSLIILKNLIEVDVSCNSLMENGAQAVVESLKNSSKLQRLYLSNNVLRTNGARKISSHLGKFLTLEELNLAGNNISDKGLIEILAHLKPLKNLKAIDLSLNSLENEGAIALAEHIQLFPKLDFLGLSCNQISTEGAIILFESLKILNQFKVIDLAHNEMDSEILNSVIDILESIKSLNGLYLSRNNIGNKQNECILNKIIELSNKVEHDIVANDYDEYDSGDDSIIFK